MNKSNKNQHKSKSNTFEVVKADAAGIDIGSQENWVCVPADRDEQRVRKFGSFTCDLYAIAEWLKVCKVATVAMESTGVYWIPLYQILEKAGFEVYLVNARTIKNVPGRTKTDRLDCQWIQKLHACGLLARSFRPEDVMCRIRTLLRHRESLVQLATVHIQHMQKALNQMNVLLHNVISDITGLTGLKIIEAIIAGERDLAKLAALRHERIQCSEETMIKSLQGDYRDEHVFTLKLALEAYKFTHSQMTMCDEQIKKYLEAMEKKVESEVSPLPPAKNRRKKPRANEPSYDLRTLLYEIAGQDLTQIPGLQCATILIILAEIGLNMARWPTAQHFTSWLGLAPNHKVSGGKILSHHTRKVQSRVALAFRRAALTLQKSKCYLGAFFRRIRAKRDTPKAITATARKLAVIVYTMLRSGKSYQDLGENYYDQEYQQKLLKKMDRQAKSLGFKLVPITQ